MSYLSVKPTKPHVPSFIEEGFRALDKKGLIYAGSKVSKDEVETALGRKYDPENPMNVMGPLINLIDRIEFEGFFVTQRDCENPGFRILSYEEMGEHARRQLVKTFQKNVKVSSIMAAADISQLDDRAQKEHVNVQRKAAQISLQQQRILLQDEIF